jgi:hypothetical protein
MARYPYPDVGNEFPPRVTLQVPPTAINGATNTHTPTRVWEWAKVTNLRGAASLFVCEDNGGAVHGVEQEILPGTTDYYYASDGSTSLYVREAGTAAVTYQIQFRCINTPVPAGAAAASVASEWGDRDSTLGGMPAYAGGPPIVPGKGA